MEHVKKISLLSLSALVVANMIGAGVFTTSGFAMGDLGSPLWVMLAWLIGGCLALCGAASYGMLTSLISGSGGEYLYLSRVIHPVAGFMAGWISLWAGFTGAIAYSAITLEVYVLSEDMRVLLPENIIATLAILVAMLAHGIQFRYGELTQIIAVVAKLLLVSGFIVFAVVGTSAGSWQGMGQAGEVGAAGFPLFKFAMTLMWVSFSYLGFNAAVYIAGEVSDAGRLVPRALLWGTSLTMLIYLLLNGIFVLAPAPELIAYKQDVAAIVAGFMGGPTVELLVRIVIVLALFTSVSAMIMVGPRVYAKMADDGLMPPILKTKQEVPTAAIVMQGILAIIVVWITTLRDLLSYLGFTLGLSAAATVASLFVIARNRDGGVHRFVGYPVIPILYIGGTLLFAGLAAVRQPLQLLAALLTFLSGAVVYYYFRKSMAA